MMMMGEEDRRSSACWEIQGVAGLLLSWILVIVEFSHAQPPLPLALPARVSVLPPWSSLALAQPTLGPLFSNSSPFSFSQPLFMLPPAGPASNPGAQASFGPYTVTQLVPESILPSSPRLTAWLLSESVERERGEERERGGGREEKEGGMGGEVRYRVRALLRVRGESRRGRCVTLHAFKETEERKASCITQPPLGLCVVNLRLPVDWFESHQPPSPPIPPVHRTRNTHQQRHRHQHRKHPPPPPPQDPSPIAHRSHASDHIQLYYSSFGNAVNPRVAPPGCEEERTPLSQRQLFYLGAVTRAETDEKGGGANQDAGCLSGQDEEELRVDSSVLIRYGRGPGRAGQPIRVSVNLRANFSAEFVVIRLKVKKGLVSLVAQRSMTSDLWAVTLDRTQGSKHDIISIICHKQGRLLDDPSSSSLHQVGCLSIDGLKQSFGVAMTVSASWWVEYSGRNNQPPPHGGVVSIFCFTDREMVGIVPITETDMIINTAILTSQPVSLPVIVLAVGHDGKVSDATSAVTCRSTNEGIVKVSVDCSTVFVDGSESGAGSTCARVEYRLGGFHGSLCLSVWAPVIPLRVSLSDPQLNAIDGWSHYSQSGCSPVYQRSSVEVLTQFVANDNRGHLTYLLGSPDWLVDMTDLVRDWLRVKNPDVATLDKQNNVIGLQPGKTSLYVISSQWDGVLGSCDVTVTSEPVSAGDLVVQVVSGLGMSIEASHAHLSVVTATVTAYNILYDPGQEATISVWIQFSDDSASLLSSFGGVSFFLRLSSLAESVVAVTPGPSQRVVARGDGGGPLLRAELLVPACENILSNSIIDGEGGGTLSLAKGSGWVRVNLDSDLRPMESEEFPLDMTDMLTESHGDIYGDNNLGDDDNYEIAGGSNVTGDNLHGNGIAAGSSPYNRWAGNGMLGRRGLERAVLRANHEEAIVFLSPDVGRERRRDEEEERLGDGGMEVGLGVIVALLCLTTLLILVNCLPCALRERRRRRKRGEMDETEEEDEEEEDDEEEWGAREQGKEEKKKEENKLGAIEEEYGEEML